MSDFFSCPNCGADVPHGALACPECGADSETGWSPDTAYDGLWLPEVGDLAGPPRRNRVPESEGTDWSRVVTIAITLLIVVAMLVTTLGRASLYVIPLLALGGVALYVRYGLLPRTAFWQERELYQALLAKARGDEALVERLIDVERQRTPNATRRDWLDAAIYKWERRG